MIDKIEPYQVKLFFFPEEKFLPNSYRLSAYFRISNKKQDGTLYPTDKRYFAKLQREFQIHDYANLDGTRVEIERLIYLIYNSRLGKIIWDIK